MPGKARRVASRQAQLSRRRKRQQERNPAEPAESPTRAQAAVSVQPEVVAPDTEVEPTTAGGIETPIEAPSVPAPRSHRPTPQPRAVAHTAPAAPAARGRRERPAAYNYIGPELRRIMALASGVLAVIVALGFLI